MSDTIQRIITRLQERGDMVAFAESCTAGLLSSMLASRPGCSQVFWGGWIVYSNHAKQHCLDVTGSTISECGAVSGEAVAEMLSGVFQHSPVDFAVAVSGIAGPDGGTPEKPVGVVWVGVAQRGQEADIRQYNFSGERGDIQHRAAVEALKQLDQILAAID